MREVGGGGGGAASVELVAVLPALLLALLIAAQLAATGHSLWSAALAARAGSRAAVVGDDGARAARRALPSVLRERARIEEEGGVAVTVAVPRLLPLLPRLDVGAEAALPESGDG